jgi:phosphatidate cytidylyltransferase
VVWASDIGAYAFGRLIGGPKLAPALSPNKTWAGAIGGLASAMVVGQLAAAFFAGDPPAVLFAISAFVAIAAQVGDLIESFAKRCFNVKDSGGLIPGHGGLLDRLDSLLLASLALALALAAATAGGVPS